MMTALVVLVGVCSAVAVGGIRNQDVPVTVLGLALLAVTLLKVAAVLAGWGPLA